MIRKNTIQIQKTARYFTLGDIRDSVKEVWIVCHGYGQLAEFFVRKFEILSGPETLIVAPEAPHRFYLQGFSGRVGASWMTKTDREEDIRDYLGFLETLYKRLGEQIDWSAVKLNALGFSQGVATVCRWLAASDIPVSQIILWAGVFPPDLNNDFEFNARSFYDKNTTVVYGLQDPFLKKEHLEQIEEMKTVKPDLKIITFEGAHDIDPTVLKNIRDGKFSG